MTASTSTDRFQRVVHHVFLPPKLPQEKDGESELALIHTTWQSLAELRDLLPSESPPEVFHNAIALLDNIKAINCLKGGNIDELPLRKILTSLPIRQTLVANVSSQNAAVLITRQPDELVFEEFELSPRDADVLRPEGRLTRTFPGLAVAVPATILNEPDFPRMIASTLSTMGHQQAPGMQ
jgi:hypothetical protein